MDKENHYKKLNRLLISIKQIGEKKINTWSISDILSKCASLYYKLDLLDNIIESLGNDIDPKNIIVFNKPIALKNNDYNFTEIDLNKDVFSVYKLGLPTSIFPNREIIELSLLFEFYQEVSTEMDSINKLLILQNIDLGFESLTKCYEIYKISGIELTINHLIGSVISKLPEQAKKIRQIFRELERNYIKRYKEFLSKKGALKNITNKLKENYIKNYNIIEHREYFNDFFDQFRRNPRPLVGIYNKEENKIKLLCSQHFNANENDNSLLVLESITHNSPYEIIISGVISIFCVLLSYYLTKQENEKRINRDDKVTLYKKIQNIYNEKKVMLNKNIKNKFLHDMLNQQLNIVVDEFEKNLNLYSFDIGIIEEIKNKE